MMLTKGIGSGKLRQLSSLAFRYILNLVHGRFIDALQKASMISDKQNAIATTVPLVQDLPVVSKYIQGLS